MGKSTFTGPVRSENGFGHVTRNTTTGAIIDYTGLDPMDLRRYTLVERFKQRPALNAAVGIANNVDFEVLGTNMTSALATFDTTRGGITITTAGADQDQAIIAPHLDTNQTAWTAVKWGTENQLKWRCSISTNAIDNQKVWAGLKLTNDHLIATDANQAFFKFATDADNGESLDDFTKLHFVYSVGGTDYISQLPITVAANTTYNLGIDIDSSRKLTIFVNGVQYNVSNTAGSTGGTAVTSVGDSEVPTKSNAMTDDVDLIPYIGIEAGAAAAEALDVHYEAISRIIFE